MAGKKTDAELTLRLKRLKRAINSKGFGDRLLRAIAERSMKKKTIKRGELRGLLSNDPEQAGMMVSQLLKAGIVAPVRSAGLTQTGEPACFRFELSGLDEEQVAEVRQHVKELDPRIWQSNNCWLLDHPAQYVANKPVVDALDHWLRSSERSGPRIGHRERAYEIWGDEKALDAEPSAVNASKLMNLLGISEDILNIYRSAAPQPFPMFLRVDSFQDPASFIVISENECLYDSVRFSKRAAIQINGVLIAGVMFGSGMRVLGPSAKGGLRRPLICEQLADIGIDAARVVYVGDIDPAGILIQQRVEDECGIAPARALYGEMARLFGQRMRSGAPVLSDSACQTNAYDRGRFLSLLDGPTRSVVSSALKKSIRIPQEILNPATWGGGRNG